MRRGAAIAVLLVLLAWAGPVSAGPVTTVPVERGVRYGTGEVRKPMPGRAPLLMDIYRPPGRSTKVRPVVVLIHGGGFWSLDRTHEPIVRTAKALAERGIVAVSIDYRLQASDPVASPRVAPLLAAVPDAVGWRTMVTAVDDTLTAIDHLVANAKNLRIDPRRIAVAGASAGAITADHVAYALDDHGIAGPKVAFSGSLWGGAYISPPGGGDPSLQLEVGEPALFAVHGTDDDQVDITFSDRLAARARDQRVPVDYVRLDDAGHGFDASGFFTRRLAGGATPLDRFLAFAAFWLRP